MSAWRTQLSNENQKILYKTNGYVISRIAMVWDYGLKRWMVKVNIMETTSAGTRVEAWRKPPERFIKKSTANKYISSVKKKINRKYYKGMKGGSR